MAASSPDKKGRIFFGWWIVFVFSIFAAYGAGVGHALVCRTNFKTRNKGITPTKWQAAKVYDELQAYYDEKETGNVLNRSGDWFKRLFKTGVVAVWMGYYHKHNVEATYEEMTGNGGREVSGDSTPPPANPGGDVRLWRCVKFQNGGQTVGGQKTRGWKNFPTP